MPTIFEPVWSERPPWTDVPAPVQAWARATLGGPVTASTDVVGGFSSGAAARLRSAAGRRIFVKAVCPALNPRTPQMYRHEARIGSALGGRNAAIPALRSVYDDGDWIALAFDEVDGSTPDWPWTEADLDTVLGAVAQLHGTLTPAQDLAVPEAADELARDRQHWRQLLESTYGIRDLARLARLEPWLASRAVELDALSQGVDLGGDTVLNLDLRADNVLIDTSGAVWFVDWPWACRGPAALDVVLLLVNAGVAGHDSQQWLARSSVADVPESLLVGALALLAGIWAESVLRPEPPGTRGLRAFQRAHLRACATWLQSLLG